MSKKNLVLPLTLTSQSKAKQAVVSGMIKFLDLVKKDTIITSEILPSVRELNSVDHAVRSDNI